MKRSYLGLSTEKDHGYTYVVVASSVTGWNYLELFENHVSRAFSSCNFELYFNRNQALWSGLFFGLQVCAMLLTGQWKQSIVLGFLRVPLSLKFDFRLPSSGSRPPPLDSPYFKTPSPGVGTFDSILTLKLQLNSYFWYGASSWLIFDHWRLNFDIIWPLVTLIGTQGTIWW